MAIHKIDGAVSSDLASAMEDYAVSSRSTDGTDSSDVRKYFQENFAKYFGYYKAIAELGAVIDAKSTWTVGKGFQADEVTTMLLDNIKGNGNDTFNTILENMIRTMHIGGDSFAEIIRDKEENLINIKPLDPELMVIESNKKGIIKNYEKLGHNNKKTSLEPHQIFHLSRNRVADEMVGTSMVERLIDIIDMRNEAMEDLKEVYHRYASPRFIFHLDTDDDTEIAKFKATNDAATGSRDNLYVPKDAVVPEVMSVAPNSTLNPLPWIESLNDYFYEAAGVPKIVIGGSKSLTEASAKIAYLAFQQTIEEEQLYVEEQILSQLNLLIELEFPASLENEMLSDNKKDKETGASQPNETQAPTNNENTENNPKQASS